MIGRAFIFSLLAFFATCQAIETGIPFSQWITNDLNQYGSVKVVERCGVFGHDINTVISSLYRKSPFLVHAQHVEYTMNWFETKGLTNIYIHYWDYPSASSKHIIVCFVDQSYRWVMDLMYGACKYDGKYITQQVGTDHFYISCGWDINIIMKTDLRFDQCPTIKWC